MSSELQNKKLRLVVSDRADSCCEYCLIPDYARGINYHLDHIISKKLGGSASQSNLAYACMPCNTHKGPNICTYDFKGETIVELYNPRKDTWSEHFELTPEGLLIPKTLIGTGTIDLLKLNFPVVVEQRFILFKHKLLLHQIEH